MYKELAGWWHLLSAPEEYEEEARWYHQVLSEAMAPPRESLLELGSGGGNNASHLKSSWRMTLVDVAEEMLAQSRVINPECEHVVGDMRTCRLGRTFDAVFIHDAICHMTQLADVRLALETAFVHTRPGGVVLVVPDETKETFRPRTESGGHDGDGRSLRYLEWCFDPDPTDDTAVADFAFLLREADGSVRVAHDRHVHGVFPRQAWLDALNAAGYEDVRSVDIDLSDVEPGTYQAFIGVRPRR